MKGKKETAKGKREKNEKDKESLAIRYREALMDLLFPLDLSCHICKKPLPREQKKVQSLATKDQKLLQNTGQTRCEDYLCPDCIEEIPWIDEPYCKKCSIPLYDNGIDKIHYEEAILRPLAREKNLCGECAEDSPLDMNLSVCLYQKPIKAAIYAFKYRDKTYLARVFALMMAKKLRTLSEKDQDFDLILSVPLHKKRLRHRGYNQADLLAKYLSQELNIPYDSKALSRIKETKTMNQLSKSQRGPNVQDAFFLENSRVKSKKILLIDDIYTTGATAKSIASLLKKHGGSHITMISIARVVL